MFRNSMYTPKQLKGSQNSLNHPILDVNQGKDRPLSAYVSPDQMNYNAYQIPQSGSLLKTQSSRDIIRQEAKLQEMKEEVRRRELRAGAILSNQHQTNSLNMRPTTSQTNIGVYKQTSLVPNLDMNSPTYNTKQISSNYGSSDLQHNQYILYNKQLISNQYTSISKKNDASCNNQQITELDKEYDADLSRPITEYNQQLGLFNKSPFLNDSSNVNHQRNMNENLSNQIHYENNVNKESLPLHSILEKEYKERHPPPPLNTSTHPFNMKQVDSR